MLRAAAHVRTPVTQASAMASMWWWLVPQHPPSTPQVRVTVAQLAVPVGEVGGVAAVELGGLVELGVAHRGGVGPDATDPRRPRRLGVEHVTAKWVGWAQLIM